MIYLGIDPGLDGALAILDDRRADGACRVEDTPTLTVVSPRGRKREYDLAAFTRVLAPFAWRPSHVRAVIEHVHAMPDQGVRSMFTMGYGVGVWHALLAAFGIRYETVTPQRWKRALMDGMGREKDASRLVAMRLFPAVAAQLARTKDHGRADALLIAEYGRRQGVEGVEASGARQDAEIMTGRDELLDLAKARVALEDDA